MQLLLAPLAMIMTIMNYLYGLLKLRLNTKDDFTKITHIWHMYGQKQLK